MEVGGAAAGTDDPDGGNLQHLKSVLIHFCCYPNFQSALLVDSPTFNVFRTGCFFTGTPLKSTSENTHCIFEKSTWIKDEMTGCILPELLMLRLKWVRG